MCLNDTDAPAIYIRSMTVRAVMLRKIAVLFEKISNLSVKKNHDVT